MYKTEIKKLENSEVEITGEVPVEKFEGYRTRILKKLVQDLELPGFRKGHVPEHIALKHFGEPVILQEMAEMALQEAYTEILLENTVDAIGRPEVTITKIAPGNPLGFKIKVAIMPELALPDYAKLAKDIFSKKELVTVEEKEIAETILEIRRRRATLETKASPETVKNISDEDLPELDDAFVQTLGDFKTVDDLKKKIEENLKIEKERRENEKRRSKFFDEILKDTKGVIPEILIDSELDRMIAQMKGDLEQMGGKFTDYLKQIHKTEEDIRKEWRTDAEKRALTQLILNKIAVTEKIEAPKDVLEKELQHLLDHYKQADPERARVYLETVLTNEEVLLFLEKQGAEKPPAS